MGLISSIKPTGLDEKLSGAEKIPPGRQVITPESIGPPIQSPLPCVSCHGPFFWLDPYGQVRCLDCLPPPAKSLVRLPLWGIAGSSGSYWWETLEDPPRVFRSGPGLEETGADLADEPPEPQVAEWVFPGPSCRQSRNIVSVLGRSRVDRGTLHWAEMIAAARVTQAEPTPGPTHAHP